MAADTAEDQVEAGPADLASPLDLLLTSEAVGPLRRFLPDRSWARTAAALARQPVTVARRGSALAAELAQVGAGATPREPAPKDRRFTEPAWQHNPFMRRSLQAWLATAETAQHLVDDADLPPRDRERVRFVVDNLIDAFAPSNNPALNPLAWEAMVDTGGRNFIRGTRNLLHDLSSAPRVPSMVAPGAFTVGESLAMTPGAVVYRSDVFELIEYAPQTETVNSIPLLIVPPVINKFYVVDLAPGRSMVEYFVQQGQPVFTISWRNPDARHRTWGFDTYGAAISSALDLTRRITRSRRSHVLGICSGGMLAAMTLAHLADQDQLGEVASFASAVAVIDNDQNGLIGTLTDQRVADAAVARSRAKGYLDGRTLAEVFAWLRPNDLIWNYWVNNYLQGKAPAAFDVLHWNGDTTRMPAALHADFIRVAMANSLVEPGATSMLASPVDLGRVDVPSYIVAGIADHISPWQACYQTTQLLGGTSRFVLSSSGHVACMVNPPTNVKATFRTSDANAADPQEWLDNAPRQQGSWWVDYVGWLARQGGRRKAAPTVLGGHELEPMEPAPGTYVRQT